MPAGNAEERRLPPNQPRHALKQSGSSSEERGSTGTHARVFTHAHLTKANDDLTRARA